MVSERYPHFSGDVSTEHFSGNSNVDMTMFNPARRWSGPISHDKTNFIAHDSMQRRCSVQNDWSQYTPTIGTNLNIINSQQRFHCIQKPPLRNVISAPQHVDAIDASRLLPRPPVIQRSDMLMQSASVESVDSTTTAEGHRYKTEMCRPFEETGQCKYNAKCQFAHGVNELRHLNRHPKYKTELCKSFHTDGFCSYGHRCTYIHNDEERRGPSQAVASSTRTQRPSLSMVLPINISMTSSSTASSVTSGSPSQSPGCHQEDRLSPALSFGSDCASLASTTYTPPGSPKHDASDYQFTHDMGLQLSFFNKLSI